jgi:hypothetical protein
MQEHGRDAHRENNVASCVLLAVQSHAISYPRRAAHAAFRYLLFASHYFHYCLPPDGSGENNFICVKNAPGNSIITGRCRGICAFSLAPLALDPI